MERIKLENERGPKKVRHYMQKDVHYWECIRAGSSPRATLNNRVSRSRLYIMYKNSIRFNPNRGWDLLRELPIGQELEFDDNSVWKRVE